MVDKKRISEKKRGYKRNIPLLYLISFLYGLAFIYDLILVIYYQSFGLSFTKISLVIMVFCLSILLAEIPTGAFADLNGKKTSLILGSATFLLSFLIILIFHSFIGFIIAAAILGISTAFNSGAESALIYESLKSLKKQKDYLKVNSKMEVIFLLTTALVAYFSTYLYSINKYIPIFITVIFGIIIFFLILSLYDEKKKVKREYFKRYYLQIKNGLIYSLNHKRILWLILFSSLGVTLINIIGNFIGTPYLLDLGFHIKQVGVIEVVSILIQATLISLVPKIEKKIGENYSFLLVILGSFVSLGLSLIFRSYLIAICFGVFWGLMTLKGLIINNYINNHLERENRATVLSIHSMITSMIAAISLPFIGLLIDSTSTILTVALVSLAYLILGAVFIFYKLIKKL